MRIRNTLRALPAAALLLAGTAGMTAAQSLPPMVAAQLNAGTAHSGIGPTGQVGVGISAVALESLEMAEVEVAGVQFGYLNDGGSLTVSTLGEPHYAAMLNAGTAYTGIGRNGAVGQDISGALPGAAVIAQVGPDDQAAY
ncbi:MAG: hypothetical protein ACR2NO_07835 [Chloroflexota bacterium]